MSALADAEAGKDWSQKKKGAAEDEIVRWHHWLNRYQQTQQTQMKNRGACHAAVHGVAKSWTWLSDWKPATKEMI